LPTSAHADQRLSNAAGLAVLSSDALSSVAYATQEILTVLILAGSAARSFSLPAASAIVLLLAIVVLSYQQTIRAYPNGGGAYTVSKENLGIYPSLIAAAALLISLVILDSRIAKLSLQLWNLCKSMKFNILECYLQ
jgi:amino acid transporter